jgi:hypothetical protein
MTLVVGHRTTLCKSSSAFTRTSSVQTHFCTGQRYGAFDSWLVTAVGGMSTVSNTTSTAWEHILVHTEPAAVTKLNEGSYSINTRFGACVTMQVDWLGLN